MHYSAGLLADIQESLWAPVQKDFSLKRDFLEVFGKKHPEWSELRAALNRLEQLGSLPLGRRLLAQGVDLRGLEEFREPFEKLGTCRNKAAHTKDRIDREEAGLLHGLLTNRGLIARVVERFPKPPRR